MTAFQNGWIFYHFYKIEIAHKSYLSLWAVWQIFRCYTFFFSFELVYVYFVLALQLLVFNIDYQTKMVYNNLIGH